MPYLPGQKYQADNNNVVLHRISDYFNIFDPIIKTPNMSRGVLRSSMQGASTSLSLRLHANSFVSAELGGLF